MKRILLICSILLSGMIAAAQNKDIELNDPHPSPAEMWNGESVTRAGWGSIDVRYKIDNPSVVLGKTLALKAWKGERVQAQAVIVAPQGVKALSFEASDLKSGKKSIPSSQIERFFVRYVIGDGYTDLNGKANNNRVDKSRFDSLLLADRLQCATVMEVAEKTVRPMWLEVKVPADAAPGKYKGSLTIKADDKVFNLPYTLQVVDRVLPEPEEWAFHLDLWQNPYSVARYFNVPLWSEEHFDRMRPVMTEYARIGGKVITTSIIRHPWNSQTEDPFESMIGKTLKMDGTWSYNYQVFDRWVEFMMSCGITDQIDCYAILPWHLTFEYYDEKTNCTQELKMHPTDKAYEDYFIPFLRDFAKHLKEKGWFERTCLAMDERPAELLNPANEIIKKAVPDFKIKGAFNYLPKEVKNLYDASGVYQHGFNEDEMVQRRNEGKKVTFYTCCSPLYPNTFLISKPAESAVLGWHAAAVGYDGYLRWAWNSWVKDPNQDSRFRTWIAGDTYLVYPEGSSIRIKQMLRGIQDYEKIRILKSELSGKKLQMLEDCMKPFSGKDFTEKSDASAMVGTAEAVLNTL